ncbi:hypothetical protein StoSoilB5_19670 [Arthrobacter sp. StoSoilB5]|nr:hypothetical protein StoSoilB5_19670 [Arthrobacter sp. StoSoilB5]GAT89422.1 hypothetical protein CVCC1112_4080 [Paenarthrobacter nicotinovorans]
MAYQGNLFGAFAAEQVKDWNLQSFCQASEGLEAWIALATFDLAKHGN